MLFVPSFCTPLFARNPVSLYFLISTLILLLSVYSIVFIWSTLFENLACAVPCFFVSPVLVRCDGTLS